MRDIGYHLFCWLEGRKGDSSMAAEKDYSLPASAVNAVVDSAERLEGAASLLVLLEDKAENHPVSSSELAAVRCIIETCSASLAAILAKV